MEILISTYKRLLNNINTDFIRYIHSKIEWENRLIAIVGARGIGKTTLLLQHIKLYDDINTSLFVFADNMYFTEHSLFELALKFYQNGGKKIYIDEIHKYKNWSREIKNIYDEIPNLNIIYTGSSILDLENNGADLSRRKLQYYMYGLSFREYLEMLESIQIPIHKFDDVLSNNIEFPYERRPVFLFHKYLQEGYYPFFKEKGYLEKLRNVINQTIEVDIPQFANMSVGTIRKLRQLLYIISKSVPFKPNISKISNDLDMSRNNMRDILFFLEKAGIISQIRNDTGGIKLLGKVEKVILDNTNLSYALSQKETNIGNIRETFFYSVMKVTKDVFASKVSDFAIDDFIFEVGGKNKGQQQIASAKNAYVVKDDIEYGTANIIPLWAFGLTY